MACHLAQDLQRTFEAARPARRIRLGGQHTGLVMGLQLHGPGTSFPDNRRLPDRTGVDQGACGRQLDQIGRGAIQLTIKSSYQNYCAAARRARPVLGILMYPRTLRFLRAARTHLTAARYVLLAALNGIHLAIDQGRQLTAVGQARTLTAWSSAPPRTPHPAQGCLKARSPNAACPAPARCTQSPPACRCG